MGKPVMKLLLTFASAITLAGIGGIIGHTAAFDVQSSNSIVRNTYVSAWFAGELTVSGLNLMGVILCSFPSNSFWWEVLFIGWSLCCNFVCLVGYSIGRDWAVVSWILVTFIPLTIALLYLFQKRNSLNGTPSCCRSKTRCSCIVFVKLMAMIVAGLLSAGAVTVAITESYVAPPGKSISVYFDGANRNGTLHLYCIGTSQPTTFLFASPAHGIVDFYGLQYYLNSWNTTTTTTGTDRRVCSYDPLGFGWSQDPFAVPFTNHNYEYLYRLMLQSGEPPPWNIIGWGAGGSAITYLASQHTSSIRSVIYLEVYPPGIEFEYYGYKNGLRPQEIEDYRTAQLSSRMGLSKLILSLAIPWGLISLFLPLSPRDPSYYPQDAWQEFRVQLWKSKAWISQLQGIQNMLLTPDSEDPIVTLSPLPEDIPTFGVYCNLTTTCGDGFQNRTTGQDCVDRIAENAYYNEQKNSMMKSLHSNATVMVNDEFDCDLGLPVEKPMFTAASILALYSTIDA